MPEIDIHQASLSQADILAAIHAASFGPAAWNPEQMQGSLVLDTTQGWVASEDGKVIGFILCQTLPSLAEILTFAVHPDAQRRGIGERLLQKVIETARSANTTRIILEVAADNHAACALYEKHGFRKSGLRPNYYKRGATAIDAVLYERVLFEQ